jgi:hypothetical protein
MSLQRDWHGVRWTTKIAGWKLTFGALVSWELNELSKQWELTGLILSREDKPETAVQLALGTGLTLDDLAAQVAKHVGPDLGRHLAWDAFDGVPYLFGGEEWAVATENYMLRSEGNIGGNSQPVLALRLHAVPRVGERASRLTICERPVAGFVLDLGQRWEDSQYPSRCDECWERSASVGRAAGPASHD